MKSMDLKGQNSKEMEPKVSVEQTTFFIETLGCKVNTYDTGVLQKNLKNLGFIWESKNPQVYIINTCAVTAQATAKAQVRARHLKRKNPTSTVVLTGCAAQVDGEVLDSCPGVDLIVANSHKTHLGNILKNHLNNWSSTRVFRSNIFRNEHLNPGGGEEISHTRSFLKIQDGCNSFCTFCIIPYARGKSRSLPVENLVAQVQKLESRGVGEIVLTGVHIGDYCVTYPPGQTFHLSDLVEELLDQTQTCRFRLTSLEPIELNEKLMNLFQNHPRLCPHFHMSVQSLSSPILKSMKRKYNATQVEESLKWIAQSLPQAFVGMDVIVGFPGESPELFQQTQENLENWPWTRLHVFPYSERKGTRASLLGESVPWIQRKQRSQKLRELSKKRYKAKALEQLGERKEAIVLSPPNLKIPLPTPTPPQHPQESVYLKALSQDYWPLMLHPSPSLQVGQKIKVQVTEYKRDHLWAKPHVGET